LEQAAWTKRLILLSRKLRLAIEDLGSQKQRIKDEANTKDHPVSPFLLQKADFRE